MTIKEETNYNQILLDIANGDILVLEERTKQFLEFCNNILVNQNNDTNE